MSLFFEYAISTQVLYKSAYNKASTIFTTTSPSPEDAECLLSSTAVLSLIYSLTIFQNWSNVGIDIFGKIRLKFLNYFCSCFHVFIFFS